MGPCALAIDLGTTAAKASVVRADGSILGSGLAPVTTVFGDGGAVEQDAEAVWQAVLGACRAAVAEAGPDAARSVEVVAPTSQWSSIVAVDAAGNPLTPMMIWMDGRGDAETDAIFAGPHGEAGFTTWPEVHGFIPMGSLGHVLHLQRSRPDVHARTAAYLEPMDYLAARFTGRLAASANSAMPYALTDNRVLGAVRWSDDLVEMSGIDASRLPELVPSMSVLAPLRPDAATSIGVRPGIAVAVGANDSIAAALGTGAVEPGRATLMIGTTGVLAAHHFERVVDIGRFVMTMPSALADRYYVVAEAGLAGKVVESLLEQVLLGDDPLAPTRPADPYERLFALAATVEPGAGGLQFLPWLRGALAPAPNLGLRGALLGMSLDTTRAHIVRAVLEGVAMQMRWLLDETEDVLGSPFRSLRLTGGGAQSDVWAQVMADVLGRPIEQVEDPRHANARGAGFLGLMALGVLAPGDLDPLVPVRRRYVPTAGVHDLYADRLALHRELHGTLAPTMHRLRHSPTVRPSSEEPA